MQETKGQKSQTFRSTHWPLLCVVGNLNSPSLIRSCLWHSKLSRYFRTDNDHVDFPSVFYSTVVTIFFVALGIYSVIIDKFDLLSIDPARMSRSDVWSRRTRGSLLHGYLNWYDADCAFCIIVSGHMYQLIQAFSLRRCHILCIVYHYHIHTCIINFVLKHSRKGIISVDLKCHESQKPLLCKRPVGDQSRRHE